jgi:teichuronic acid exporter
MTTLGTAIVDFGLSGASIARQTRDPRTLSTLFWANFGISCVLAILLIAASPFLAALIDAPELIGFAPVVAAGLFATALGQQSVATLQRDLRFSRLATIEVAGAVAGGTVTVGAAVLGAGAVSLALGFLGSALIRTPLLLASHWQEWHPYSLRYRSPLSGHVWFGAHFAGQRVVGQLGSNVDYLIVGHFMGAAALGSYTLAYELAVRPYMLMRPVQGRVVFPLFARRQSDNASLRRGLLEVNRFTAFLLLPLLGGLAVLAPELFTALFGDKWDTTVTLLPAIVIVGALKSLESPTGSVYLAKQRPDIGSKFALYNLGAITLVLALAAQISLLAVAWAYVGVTAVNTLLVRRIVLYRLIGLTFWQYARAVAPAAAITLSSIGLVVALRPVLDALSIDVRLIALAVAFIGALLTQLLLLERSYLRYLWRVFRARPPDASALPRIEPQYQSDSA